MKLEYTPGEKFPVVSIWIEKEEIQDELENMLYPLSPGGQVYPEEFFQLILIVIQQEFHVDTWNHDDVVNIVGDLSGVKKIQYRFSFLFQEHWKSYVDVNVDMNKNEKATL